MERLIEVADATRQSVQATEVAVRQGVSTQMELRRELDRHAVILQGRNGDSDGLITKIRLVENALERIHTSMDDFRMELTEIRRALRPLDTIQAREGRVQWGGVATLVSTVTSVVAILVALYALGVGG
jgi:hypothetical protein